MKKTDKPSVVTINGDNNGVFFGGGAPISVAIVVFAIAIVVLAISLSCPELLADFVRWIIGEAISG